MRIIMHIDMDSFFTAVEVRRNPSLREKPVVVGADPKQGRGRGVVSTCSYQAREYGIHSGMPISKAYRLCPEAIFLPVNYSLYQKVSDRIMNILRKYGDKFEPAGIDEAYLDVTSKVGNYKQAIKIALKIKREIFKKERLSCSIGIAPNKSVAKIASDYKKPASLTIVGPRSIKKFLFPLAVRKLSGVGPKTESALKELGIETIGDLAKYNKQKLVDYFGKWGLYLHLLANGIDEEEVEESWETKSIGREFTFEEDTDNEEIINKTIDNLARRVHSDLLEEGYSFRTVVLKIRFEDFETHTKQRTLVYYTTDKNIINKVSKELISDFLHHKKIRLIGIRLTNLEERKEKILKEYVK